MLLTQQVIKASLATCALPSSVLHLVPPPPSTISSPPSSGSATTSNRNPASSTLSTATSLPVVSLHSYSLSPLTIIIIVLIIIPSPFLLLLLLLLFFSTTNSLVRSHSCTGLHPYLFMRRSSSARSLSPRTLILLVSCQ
ncbi:hypothetical protein M406DRAFT_358656 [Cryphonectria parasitica EP155]|uniref:Uncharacterized protein n=1 Tax=Cryphonectria parasitica (strain ATCC 38755 / EP155) TaxID=660469 RepID=A0A9P5CJQ1_CRYP1|nr:uncharacterized protein M406DRAFT_358656 [Cryphonectria parasitica EP155]KAF3759950.1 hypothetical protein M406DRAFT_358656 [Cryphonectria parasitica EP155]